MEKGNGLHSRTHSDGLFCSMTIRGMDGKKLTVVSFDILGNLLTVLIVVSRACMAIAKCLCHVFVFWGGGGGGGGEYRGNP